MSAIIARVIFGVGLGAVAAVLYTIFTNNNRNNQHHHGHGGRGGGPPPPPPRNDDDFDWNRWKSEDTPPPTPKASKRKTRKEKDEEGGGDLKGCPICLDAWDSLKRKQVPIWTTPCGHLFCYPCLRQAIHQQRGGACPQCRGHIKMAQCHKIFL